jgi:hypothetical protein
MNYKKWLKGIQYESKKVRKFMKQTVIECSYRVSGSMGKVNCEEEICQMGKGIQKINKYKIELDSPNQY